MGISREQIVAVGVGVSLALIADGATDMLTDGRPAYPKSVVCTIALQPGQSPHTLAQTSLFATSASDVIRRSQFINPDALLAHDAGDNDHYEVGSFFNVMPQDVSLDRPTNRPFFEEEFRERERMKGSCDINTLWASTISNFPRLSVAANILKSTVAVIEQDPRPNAAALRRCGAIAVGANLVLPSTEFSSDKHDCAQLRSAESADEQLKIMSDRTAGPWRVLETDKPLKNHVEIDDDYVPKRGDMLIYSGYDGQGGRQYFRVVVAGVKDGRLMLRAGVDQAHADKDIAEYLNHIHGGTGGFFTPEGGLVALTEDTASIMDVPDSAYINETFVKYALDYNKWLRAKAEAFGFPIDYGNDEEQYVFALRITTQSLAQSASVQRT